MKLRWSQQAENNRSEILAYIGAESPTAARRMNALFTAAAVRLRSFPYLGRIGILPGTREFTIHPNYRLLYEIADREIVVLALLHASRQWPPEPEDGS